jgi:fatty acid desaturase
MSAAVPDLKALRAELTAAGVFQHRELQSWLKLAILLAGTAGCLVAIAYAPWWGTVLAILCAAVFVTSAAMIGHEGSHRSFSASPLRNTIVMYFAFPLFSGLSALYWRDKHDRLHHGHPNVHGHDPDIRPWPFVSCREEHVRCNRVHRWFHRHFQGWAFWPMTPLMALGMRRMSLQYLIAYPRRRGVDRAWLIDVATMLAHYAWNLLLPSLIWGPLVGFGIYTAVWAISGVLLVLIFAPAHIGLPVVVNQQHEWTHQLETTRNLELPRFISWFFIGLDYQVEHHLFPKIPHQNLPLAAKITRAWCERQGVTYKSEPYAAAVADATRFIANAWEVSLDEQLPANQLARQSG